MLKKKSIKLLLKSIVSISLLLVILTKVDWETVLKNFKSASIIFLFIAFLLNIFERFELTYKWNLLIRVRGLYVHFNRLFLINSIGSFLGLFLPSSLGTDVIRGYYLIKNNSEKSISVSSVFVDRILGMFSLLLLGVISVFFAGDLISIFNIRLYIISLFIIAVIAFYIFQRNETVILLEKISKRIKLHKFTEKGIKLHSSILSYKRHPKTLMLSFFITLLVQVTRVFTYYFFALAFNISLPLVYYFLFIPIIMLIIMIPISIGGLGVKEGTFVAFFTLIGMTINNAVTISFTNSLIDTINTLIIGGGAYLFYKTPLKEQIIPEDKHNLVNSNE